MSSRRSRKGGSRDGNDVQPVEEILAKLALDDEFFQILVRGGDDAHVDLHRVARTDALEGHFLQDAQQLGLHVEADVADLVQKQRCRRRPSRIGRPCRGGVR